MNPDHDPNYRTEYTTPSLPKDPYRREVDALRAENERLWGQSARMVEILNDTIKELVAYRTRELA